MSKRTAKVMITNECRVLKELRIGAGLSMRQAAERLNVSPSLISQIENGRENFPQDDKLQRFLDIYGGIKAKSFYERVRLYKAKANLKEELIVLVEKLEGGELVIASAVIEGILKSGAIVRDANDHE